MPKLVGTSLARQRADAEDEITCALDALTVNEALGALVENFNARSWQITALCQALRVLRPSSQPI